MAATNLCEADRDVREGVIHFQTSFNESAPEVMALYSSIKNAGIKHSEACAPQRARH